MPRLRAADGYVLAMASTNHSGNDRLTRTSAWVSSLALVVVACGGGGGVEELSAGTTTTAGASGATTLTTEASITSPSAPTTSPAPQSTTVDDPWAVTEPVEVLIEWNCDSDLIDRGGGLLVSACSAGRIEPWFTQGNWFVSIRYLRDDDGIPIAVEAAANGYNGHCMWSSAIDSIFDEVPIIDGRATHEGTLFGNGRCEGLRFVYQNTWDIELQTNVTSGIIEPIA